MKENGRMIKEKWILENKNKVAMIKKMQITAKIKNYLKWRKRKKKKYKMKNVERKRFEKKAE